MEGIIIAFLAGIIIGSVSSAEFIKSKTQRKRDKNGRFVKE